MVGKAVNTNWGFNSMKPNENVILNVILCINRDNTTCFFFLFFFSI